MRYLVTGSTGFIGTHLVKYLRKSPDHEVLGIDHTGAADEVFELLETLRFEKVLKNFQPDVVIHLAAQWGRVFGEDDPANSIRQNAIITTLIARATVGTRLVYASTSEVYGHHSGTVDETYVGFPTTIYGMTKRWGEEACRLYHPQKLTIARLSMPYGPGSPPGRGRRAMDTFMWQANHGFPITVHKGGKRSWCYITDIIDALLLVGRHDGVWHVGRDDDLRTMEEIARRACVLAEAPFTLITTTIPPADQVVTKKLSTRKLFSLGWRPEVTLDEGMNKVWDHIRHFDAEGVYVAGS